MTCFKALVEYRNPPGGVVGVGIGVGVGVGVDGCGGEGGVEACLSLL